MNVEEFYNKESSRYDQTRWTGPVGEYVHQTYAKIVAKCIPIATGAKYLEIGCGTGRFTVPLAAKGIDLTALDVSDEMLSVTGGRVAKLGGGTRVRLLKADARNTDFENETFDVIFSFNVINHVPEYERVVVEVARLLKPGGLFVVGYSSLWSLYLPYAALVNLTRRSLHRGVYTRWPSTPALVRQARTLGLERRSLYGMFHFPVVRNPLLAGLTARILRLLGHFGETGLLRPVATIHIATFCKT